MINHTEPRFTPRPQSRGSRNTVKQRIRNRLGTVGDGAPSTYRTVLATQDMTELLHLATDGRLQLQVLDTHTGHLVDLRNVLAEADRSDAS